MPLRLRDSAFKVPRGGCKATAVVCETRLGNSAGGGSGPQVPVPLSGEEAGEEAVARGKLLSTSKPAAAGSGVRGTRIPRRISRGVEVADAAGEAMGVCPGVDVLLPIAAVAACARNVLQRMAPRSGRRSPRTHRHHSAMAVSRSFT